MGLCTRCHERVTAWDNKPATPLLFVTFAYLIWRGFWNIVLLVITTVILIVFVRAY